MENSKQLSNNISLEDIITTSIKIPGVKVNRDKFLAEHFAGTGANVQDIINLGPIDAGISREDISNTANKLIIKRTSQSSVASFVAGMPGGLAMAATIPADVMQFFGMALRLAQELAYLYGGGDLWVDGQIDDEKVKSQLIMYCGVMFGVSGAVSGVRVLSTQIAKTTLKKLPQKALTKTFWYPIIKQIGKAIGVKVTKTTVAQSASKAIPIIGGVISGGLNFASMMPMAKRLSEALDKATFDYSEDEYENIIKKEKRKSKYEKILDKYKFDKTKKAYSSLKEVLSISDNYKNTEVFSLEKVFREIAERKNVKSYIINNDCKRILDNTYLENRAIFEENKYYKKPTLREFVLQELNLQDAKIKENICESKEKSSEVKENVICDITPNIGDIENTFVKVSVKTIMEWSYQKRIFR